MSYTGEQVDELIRRFERAASKQVANKNQTVKLRAAERDLLKEAEDSRDLMMRAVKGDKKVLEAVFGGTCERFHRYRQVLDTVELSDMHASDARWHDIKEACDIIEEVLKTLGVFKPWKIGAIPPEYVTYTGLKPRYCPGEKVRLLAECPAIDVVFSISPALPEGLALNAATGEIRGALPMGQEMDEATYTVTATNDKGQASTEICFSVKPPAPESITYPGETSVYTSNAVNWAPTVSGGHPKEWTVSPELPDGLYLDKHTGVISGVPMQEVAAADYTVTAANSSGACTAAVHFGVQVAPPVSLTYPDAEKEYPFGSVVRLVPKIDFHADKEKPSGWSAVRDKAMPLAMRRTTTASTVKLNVAFSIEPELPDGLMLSTVTGVIMGQPSSPGPEVTYTITARNSSGEATCELAMGFPLTAPSDLSYPDAEEAYFTGQPMSLAPEVQGMVSEWSVEPALPAGLVLDACTGSIDGTPTEVTPAGSWTVTAKNPEGETTASLEFAVRRAPPAGLAYPSACEEYPLLRAVCIQPTVAGEVDEYSITPDLPPGMSLDAKTGAITGTPTEVSTMSEYTITAKNETGETDAKLAFSVKVMPPADLSYPGLDDNYDVGEDMVLEPEVYGGASSWSVEPALPEGMNLDPETGRISGAPKTTAKEASYVVTASNEAGGTSAVLTFAVMAPKPEGLSYPFASDDYTVGVEMSLEPEIASGICSTYSVTPELPPGLSLDSKTGAISGTPTEPTDEASYRITAKNIAGSTSTTLTFACTESADESGVNQAFAAMVEEVTEVTEMPEEPSKGIRLSDWMIWMVHRAYLDDPSLTDFNFSGLRMPYPYMEPRVAPKLCKALETNTHIISLQLADSNLQKTQGPDLAASLASNTTLRKVNVENNYLDSSCIQQMALALHSNKETTLEQFFCINQKNMGEYFGRPVEEAVEQMMKNNTTIVKLGFTCADAHWRNEIDRHVLRNVDLARRKRKRGESQDLDSVAAEQKPLATLSLVAPPDDSSSWEVFDNENSKMNLVRGQVASTKRLPNSTQLQSYARSQSQSLKYSEVAPLIKEFRKILMDAVVGSDVTVQDIYGSEFSGVLRSWTEKNENWSLDIWPSSDKRYNFTLNKQPIIEISSEFAAWLAVE